MNTKPKPQMPYRINQPFHPNRPKDQHPPIVQDFINLNRESKQIAVTKMIAMIDDLRGKGTKSRFSKHLFDAVYELKSRTPIGGARVYYLDTSKDGEREFQLVHAECKDQDEADDWMLGECLEILESIDSNFPPTPKQAKRKTKT
jgi:hypothetical protein